MRVTIFLVVGCLGLGTIVVARQHGSNAELARLQQELTVVSRNQRLWPAQQRSQGGANLIGLRSAMLDAWPAPAPSTEPPGAAPDDVAPDASDQQVMAESDQDRADEELARLDSAFEGESYDAPWANQAQAQVQEGMEEGGTTVRSVECRATLCRAEVEHADGPSRDQFMRSLLTPSRFWGGEIQAVAQPTPQGDLRTVAFFAREERPL